MLERKIDDDDLFCVVRWTDEGEVLRAQWRVGEDEAIVCFGYPLCGTLLTEREAVTITDEFAGTVAVLFSEMRKRLDEMRGGQ